MICRGCGEAITNSQCACVSIKLNRAVVLAAVPDKKVFKDDSAKLRMLCPPEAIVEVNKVFAFGAKKYSANAWRTNPIEWSRISDALERHFYKWKAGKDLDEESGLLELAHLATNAVMLLQYAIDKIGTDDRYKGGK